MSQISGWGSVNAVGDIVHIEEVYLLQDVVSVVERPGCRCQASELFNQTTVLPQQAPNFILKIIQVLQSGTNREQHAYETIENVHFYAFMNLSSILST